MDNDRADRSYRDYRSARDDPNDRGFFERAGDEVRSWFGDDEAERRRRIDERYDDRIDQRRYASTERGGYRSPETGPNWYRSNRDEFRRGASSGGIGRNDDRAWEGRQFDDRGYDGAYGRDRSYGGDRTYEYRDQQSGRQSGQSDYDRSFGASYGLGDYRQTGGNRDYSGRDEHGYGNWRDRQMNALDRDYDEYRRENQSRFESEFSTWRQNRQTQRDSLGQVKDHQEVVGSDGTHVGTVDHVRSDHILLTKNDKDAGGHHHSIPSSWIASVGDKVQLSKTADEAKRLWREGDQGGVMFGRDRADQDPDDRSGHGQLNRSFSGTY